MDPLRLLSRSTKLSKGHSAETPISTPSAGQNLAPQLFRAKSSEPAARNVASRKRKREQSTHVQSEELDFFGSKQEANVSGDQVSERATASTRAPTDETDHGDVLRAAKRVEGDMSLDDRKVIMKQHKLKVTWLNSPSRPSSDRQRGSKKKQQKSKLGKDEKVSLFPMPLLEFSGLREHFRVSRRLAFNVEDQGYSVPTEVQLGAIPLLLAQPKDLLPSTATASAKVHQYSIDLLAVAPTGSGKTLAFAIPLLHRIIESRRSSNGARRTTSAIILAPTKELSGQISNECRKLARDTGVKITQVRKDMRLARRSTQEDGEDECDDDAVNSTRATVKSDVLVSTPGALASIIQEAGPTGCALLPDVCHLVLDEADVLLDPLFRDQTMAIWNALSHHHLQVSLWSATMGSNIEQLARSVISERRSRLLNQGHSVPEAPLIRLVVGLKDSAVPNIDHRLVYAASEQGKLMGLRQLLHPATSSVDTGPPLLPPFLIFTQTIERAVALHSELLYDIPAEAGGIARIAVLHSDLSDMARDSVMTRFRKGEIWVLITTDLLSRGVDFRGVNGVVNYDIPTSSAAYVHRVGRTGRAGRDGGIAVTLYSKDDIPYLKHVANVVAIAEKQREAMGESKLPGVQQWLLDALPSLSKKAKINLKKHGVESRTARGMKKDSKTRISSKAGYVRREENKRKGAILGSKKRQESGISDRGDETDLGDHE